MRKEHKLVALCAVLPVLADFIEDLNDQYVFKQDLKRKANILADEIRNRTTFTRTRNQQMSAYKRRIKEKN